MPGESDGILFWAASLVALLGNVVHLHAKVEGLHLENQSPGSQHDKFALTG